MRILNVIRFPIGGIRSYLRYTYSKLPGAYSTTILTIDRPEANLLPAGMAPLAVSLRTVPEERAFVGLALAANTLLREQPFDVVHSQGATAALASDLSARRFGVRHVVTLHETFRAEQFAGTIGAIKRRWVSRALRRADAVITVTTDARDNLFEFFPLDERTRQRVEVIRNGVDVETLVREAAECRPNLRTVLNIPANVVMLAYVGRFMPEKGFGVLLEAVRRLRTQSLPRFVVVAVNDGAFLREYQQQIREWGLEGSFAFTGLQPTAAGVLAEADGVIMPSLREACGLVAMEAMVIGCPLIASDCIGLREVVSGTPSLQASAGDADSLASAMREMIEHKLRFREAAADYVATARLAFDSSNAAKRLMELFERPSPTKSAAARP